MTEKKFYKVSWVKETAIFLVIIASGLMYVLFIWNDINDQNINMVLQNALSIEASLPKEELDSLPEDPKNLEEHAFDHLRKSIRKVIEVNPNAKFAYVYILRNDKFYFLADSEPESSPDYSHTGQNMGLTFDPKAPDDRRLFYENKALVTKPVTDQWGTWVSVQVPVMDEETGQMIAALGMDYNAGEWKNRILFEVSESCFLVIFILFLVLLFRRNVRRNMLLEKEIAQREKAQKDLQENDLVLTNLISNLPGMVYRCSSEPNYSMIFVSEACFSVTGYRPGEFTKDKPIVFIDLILPEYRQSIKKEWQQTIAEKSIFEAEYPIRKASGEICWVWERRRFAYSRNGELQYLEGYIENITERKLAEDELKKLSQAVEQNPASIVITDADGVIEYINPRFTEISGYEPHEAIGNNPRILKSGEMPPDFYTGLWATITSGKMWKGALINRNKAGKTYWANKSISPILNNKGQITHYVAIAEDITEKKKTEEELIKAKEKAEESDRLKSAFLANISHEIRTPMNGILGFAELLKSPDLSVGNQQEFIDIIEKSGQRMLNIINDLIDISKIEANQIMLNISTTNLNLLEEELFRFFNPEFKSKGLELKYTSGLSGTKCLVRTDSLKLYQILSNLIKNAFKFTSSGRVEFGYRLTDASLNFFVKDTGIGIPDDQRNIIFERFRQGNCAMNRKYEGAGLGLTISKAYIELLGGSIQLESEPGKGTEISFQIPYTPALQENILSVGNEN